VTAAGVASDRPRVSVIVSTWNTRDLLARCLATIEQQEVLGGFETIVVDDASTDGTAELLRRGDHDVRVISNDESVGYAAANNQAAAEARGDVLVLLNADTELLAPDTLARLADAAQAPGVGIAGPRVVNPDGSLQPSCSAQPSVTRAVVVGSGMHRVLPNRLLRRLAPEFWSHDEAADVGWLLGAAIAVRTGVFQQLGGLWLQPYAQEQDLAYRVRRLGYRVRYDNSAQVLHVGNSSYGQRQSDVVRAVLVARAELTFLRTHYPRRRAFAIRAIVGASYAVRALLHRLLGHSRRAAIYRALARVYATYWPVPVVRPADWSTPSPRSSAT
jgi:GT2 family glycosyltransferase